MLRPESHVFFACMRMAYSSGGIRKWCFPCMIEFVSDSDHEDSDPAESDTDRDVDVSLHLYCVSPTWGAWEWDLKGIDDTCREGLQSDLQEHAGGSPGRPLGGMGGGKIFPEQLPQMLVIMGAKGLCLNKWDGAGTATQKLSFASMVNEQQVEREPIACI